VTSNSAGKWETDFDIEKFSINSLTDKLIQVIEEKPGTATNIKSRNLLLTFDYELFLGKMSGTVENCIIQPTNKILDIFSSYKISKAIFFVDCTHLQKLNESKIEACKNDFEKIKTQLIDIVKRGHYIFPHLHPHWKDATYDPSSGQWQLEVTNTYRFNKVSEAERDLMFSFSINLIKEIQNESGITYPIDSFRAGGWCLQPFSDFKPYFEKHGIVNDFSVLRGFSLAGKNISYDFTKIPVKNIYRFTEEVEKEELNGKFREFVISVLKVSNKRRLMNKFLYKYLSLIKDRGYGDGYSAVDGEAEVIRSIQDMEEKVNYKSEMAAIELLTILTYPAYEKQLIENDYTHLISHPKMVTDHSLYYFKNYLRYALANYEVNTDYKKLSN